MDKSIDDRCNFCEAEIAEYNTFIADTEYANERPFTDDDQIDQIRACGGCAFKLTGADIGNSETEEVCKLVFEHDGFQEISNQLPKLLKFLVCHSCGSRIGEDPDERFEYARRSLRLIPDILTDSECEWTFTCEPCASQGFHHCGEDTDLFGDADENSDEQQ